jgi:hypothetical protein
MFYSPLIASFWRQMVKKHAYVILWPQSAKRGAWLTSACCRHGVSSGSCFALGVLCARESALVLLRLDILCFPAAFWPLMLVRACVVCDTECSPSSL